MKYYVLKNDTSWWNYPYEIRSEPEYGSDRYEEIAMTLTGAKIIIRRKIREERKREAKFARESKRRGAPRRVWEAGKLPLSNVTNVTPRAVALTCRPMR